MYHYWIVEYILLWRDLNNSLRARKSSRMPFPWFSQWGPVRESGYRAVETSERIVEKPRMERYTFPPNESTISLGSFPSTSSSIESGTHVSRRSNALLWFSRHLAVVSTANVLLFLTSVALFVVQPFRRPYELNYALKHVSTYCTKPCKALRACEQQLMKHDI